MVRTPFFALALLACNNAPATRIDWVIQADAGFEIAAVRFQVFSTSELPEEQQADFTIQLSQHPLPLVHPITPRNEQAGRGYRVVFTALDVDENIIGVQNYRGKYVSGRVIQIPVRFQASCSAAPCSSLGLRCDDAACTTSSPSDETAQEADTRIDFVVDADASLAISRVVFQTPGSVSHNFDVPVGEGFQTEIFPVPMPVLFTARRERDSLGPFTSQITFYSGSGVEPVFLAQQTVRWRFTAGQHQQFRIHLSANCRGSDCDGLGYRCVEGICREQCLVPQFPGTSEVAASSACEDVVRGNRCVSGRFVAEDGPNGFSFSPAQECLLGCDGLPTCRRVQPSNLADRLLPAPGSVGRSLIVTTGDTTAIDTDSCNVEQDRFGNDVLVCEYDDIRIEDGAELRIPESDVPVILLVSGEVEILGILSVRPVATPSIGPLSGEDGVGTGGGGGGGLGNAGGRGGDGSGPGGSGGARDSGPLSLEPIPLGGSGGTRGAGLRRTAGGRLQISAGVRIVVDGDGGVNADGRDGGGNSGSGGGSGGVLLFEAPEVRIRAGRPPSAFRRITVAGGQGGQGSTGVGGGGGGRTGSGGGGDGESGTNGGGGGGGIGMIRINAIGATPFDYEDRMTGVFGQTISVGDIRIASPALQ